MALAKVALGNTAAAANGLSRTITPSVAAAVGDVIVVDVAIDNTGSAGAAPTSLTVVDNKANNYTLYDSQLVDPGAAAAGSYLARFTATVTTALTTSDTITITTTSSAAIAAVASKLTAATGFRAIAMASTKSSTTAGTTASVATGTLVVGDLVLGAVSIEQTAAPTADSDTLNGSWAAQITGLGGNSGTTTSNQVVAVQSKIVTGTGAQTYNVAFASADACIMATVFREISLNQNTTLSPATINLSPQALGITGSGGGGGGGGPVALVQSVLGKGLGSAATATLNVTAGNLILVMVTRYENASSPPNISCSDNRSNVYTGLTEYDGVGSPNAATLDCDLRAFWAVAGTTASTTVTIPALNGLSYNTVVMMEWSGVDTTSPIAIGVSAKEAGPATTMTANATGAMAVGNVAVGWMTGTGADEVISEGAGWTLIREEENTNNWMGISVIYQTATTTSTLTPTWTQPNTWSYVADRLVLKVAPGGSNQDIALTPATINLVEPALGITTGNANVGLNPATVTLAPQAQGRTLGNANIALAPATIPLGPQALGITQGSAPGSGIAYVAGALAAATGGNPTAVTSGIDTTGANLLVIASAWGNAGGTLAPSDSKGNTWTLAITQAAGGGNTWFTSIWYAKNAIVGPGHTFSLTSTGVDQDPTLEVAAFSGADTTAPLDQTSGYGVNGFTNTIKLSDGGAGLRITPTTAGQVVVQSALHFDSVTTATVSDGFTLIGGAGVASNSGTSWGGAAAYKIQTTAAVTDPNFAGNIGWGVIAGASFKPATASPTPAIPAGASFAASLTIPAPSGVTSATTERVVLFYAWADSAAVGTITPPTGFVLRGAKVDTDRIATGGYWIHTAVFDSNGTDQTAVANFVGTHSGATFYNGGCFSFRVTGTAGWDSTAGVGAASSATITQSTPMALPSITTTVANELAVALYSGADGGSTPSGWTDSGGFTTGQAVDLFSLPMPTVGATGTATVTPNTATDVNLRTIAYLPVATGGSAQNIALNPAIIALASQPMGRTTGNAPVALAPATINLVEPALGVAAGNASTALAPATINLAAQALGKTTGNASVALTQATITLVPQALDRTSAISIALTPSTLQVQAQAVGRTPGNTNIAASPATMALVAQALGLTPAANVALSPATVLLVPQSMGVNGAGPLSLTLAPATIVLVPQAGGITAGGTSQALAPATITLQSQAAGVTPGTASLGISPATITLQPQALARTAATLVALSPATVALTALGMGLTAGGTSIPLGGTALIALVPQSFGVNGAGPLSLTLAPATIVLVPQGVSAVGGATSIAANPSTISVVPQALARSASASLALSPAQIAVAAQGQGISGATSLAMSPATILLVPQALAKTVGPVSLGLTPATIQLVAGAMNLASGAGPQSLALSPAVIQVIPVALDKASGAISISMLPGTITVAAQSLSRSADRQLVLAPASIGVSAQPMARIAARDLPLTPAIIVVVPQGLNTVGSGSVLALSPAVIQVLASQLVLQTTFGVVSIPGSSIRTGGLRAGSLQSHLRVYTVDSNLRILNQEDDA